MYIVQCPLLVDCVASLASPASFGLASAANSQLAHSHHRLPLVPGGIVQLRL